VRDVDFAAKGLCCLRESLKRLMPSFGYKILFRNAIFGLDRW